jgi:hypothetical protein
MSLDKKIRISLYTYIHISPYAAIGICLYASSYQLLRIRVQPKEDTKTNLATTVASSDSRS